MIGSMPSVEVEIARQQWSSGARRLDETRGDRRLHDRLMEHVSAITDELRRRLGRNFSLDELADVYRGSERWTLDTIEDADSEPGWERHATVVVDAAFYLYARGAADYTP
jgi:hypothetical protein